MSLVPLCLIDWAYGANSLGFPKQTIFLHGGTSRPIMKNTVRLRTILPIFLVTPKQAMITAITFEFKIPPPQTSAPAGYLFVCPMERFQTGPHSFRWPAFPAWSLDRSGASILSTEEATHMGFPSMESNATVRTRSYDASVYAGLRKFHEAKGFDAESQDVARHLGVPLYQIPGRKEGPCAHGATT
jgi:hypothetical protein